MVQVSKADIMRAMLGEDDEKPDTQLPVTEQEQALTNFLTLNERQPFSVGQRVRPNLYGLKRYKFPAAGQVGVVTRVFSWALDEDNNVSNVEIAVLQPCAENGHLRTYMVDGRYYEEGDPAAPADTTSAA